MSSGEKVLDLIEAIQVNHPCLRVGQILAGAIASKTGRPLPDLFYIEDEALFRAIADAFLGQDKEEGDD